MLGWQRMIIYITHHGEQEHLHPRHLPQVHQQQVHDQTSLGTDEVIVTS